MEDLKTLPEQSHKELTDLVDNLEIETEADRLTDKSSFVEDYESLEFEDIYSFVCSTDTPSFDEEPEKEGDQAPSLVTPDESELQGLSEEDKVKQREMWQQELAKIEEEIQTLKHVLQSKQRSAQELKRKLGISVWRELSEDFNQGVRNVMESNVYQNVEEKFSQWGKAVADAPIYQKTESVMKATAESTRSILGGLTGGFTQKIGQLKNSDSFRSLEEKVGSAYENVKTKVSSSRSNSVQSFNEVLQEESSKKSSIKTRTSPTIPEDKLS